MRRLLALVVVVLGLLSASSAQAQLHWDASAGVGLMHRWVHDGGSADQPRFGPAAQIAGHVALLPLIRVGAYFGGDISPIRYEMISAKDSTRTIVDGGLQVQITIPVFPKSMRGWVSLGFGGGSIDAHSFHATRLNGRLFEGASGGFFEIPLGIGASYKFWKPWSIFAELTGRALFANFGALHDSESNPDRWAAGLSVGAMVEL